MKKKLTHCKTVVLLMNLLFVFTQSYAQTYIEVQEELPISCYGQHDGSITVVAHPIGSYTYSIDGGLSTNTFGYFNNLSAGNHTICATDANGSACQVFTILEPDSLSITFITDSMVSCQGNDGTIRVEISGGTIDLLGNYLTVWTNASGLILNNLIADPFALSLSNLGTGNYTVHVEDDNGCHTIKSAAIETAQPISINATFNPIPCYNGSTFLNISSTGGVAYPPNYFTTVKYSMNGSPFSYQSSYQLNAGTYTVVAIDEKSCSASSIVTIPNPMPTFNNTNIVSCNAYTWSLNGLTYTSSGTYTYTSMNSSGCEQFETLQLTINYATSDITSTTQCDAYNWNGITYTTSGVYTYTSLNSTGCLHTSTLNLTINYATSSTQSVTACNSYTWSNGVTYTLAGTYQYHRSNSNGCDSALTLNLILNNGVRISPKAFLFGAYDSTTGLMKDSLRAAVSLGNPTGAIPIPFLIPPHIPSSPTHFLPANGAQIAQGVLNISGPNAIVDWVFIELRDAYNMNTVITSMHALIQRDGDVVSTDGVSALLFPHVCPGNYYIAIKHRNHLGVLSANPYFLSANTQFVDFTTGNAWVKPGVINTPQRHVQGVYTLWAGDANNNKNVKYNGASNDKEAVLNAVLGAVPFNYPFPPSSNTTYGYRNEDVNMDGKVRYLNAENDRSFILDNVITGSPTGSANEILSQHTPN